MKNLAVNLSLFKIGWLAAVLTAAAKIPAAGVAVVATVAAVGNYAIGSSILAYTVLPILDCRDVCFRYSGDRCRAAR